MKCKVVHETGGSLRVKILGRQLSYKEYEALHGLLEKAEGVQRIRTYWATGSIAGSGCSRPSAAFPKRISRRRSKKTAVPWQSSARRKSSRTRRSTLST